MIVECPGCKSRYDVTGRPPGTRARCRCSTVFTLPEPTREVGRLSCPSCGATVAPGTHKCSYCTAALLVRACPRCFARIFHGAKHCTHCGAEVTVPAAADVDGSARRFQCPRCESSPELVARLVGDVLLDECGECHGVWLDASQLERLIEERKQASTDAVLGMGGPGPIAVAPVPKGRVYVKCPECDAVMNRVNFARRSGIILDVCRSHGTWFDHNELPKVIEFVMQGGIDEAQRREIERLKEEARRERERARNERSSHAPGYHLSGVERVSMFGGLLGLIGAFLRD